MTTRDHSTGTHLCDHRFAAVGLLGGLAGTLLLIDADATAQQNLAKGAFDALPDRLAWLGALARGESVDPETLDEPNRSLLRGDEEALTRLAEAEPDGTVAAHLRQAAYRLGAETEPDTQIADVDPRVMAYHTATTAYMRAAEGDTRGATALLREAAAVVAGVSPGASARYCGEAAMIAESDPDGRASQDAALLLDLESAAVRLDGLAFEELRGELLMTRARLLTAAGAERPALLQEAIRCYQRATQALPRRTYPVAYAICHLNVAVAYLSMPMNHHASKLRSAIAAQSLREALEIFTPEDHGEMWASATLNLANALQHMPSSHVGDNLMEAVGLYETLLEHRGEEGPARARVLANLGNALAHLGRLDDARDRLLAARSVFEDASDRGAIEGIDGVLAEIERVGAGTPEGTGHGA